MKLDPDLIRKILIAYENLDDENDCDPIEIDGFSANQINKHQELLVDEGYIKAKVNHWISGDVEIWPNGLTMKGYELLKSIRDNKLWKKSDRFHKVQQPYCSKDWF